MVFELQRLRRLHMLLVDDDPGADDYVVKPFDARHLMARIRLLARMKGLEQQDD